MNLFADGEAALKAAATASGESLAAARTQVKQKLESAGAALAEATQPVIDAARKSAAVTDDLVRSHPWTVAGAAIAAGVAAGMLIGFLLARRSGD